MSPNFCLLDFKHYNSNWFLFFFNSQQSVEQNAENVFVGNTKKWYLYTESL